MKDYDRRLKVMEKHSQDELSKIQLRERAEEVERIIRELEEEEARMTSEERQKRDEEVMLICKELEERMKKCIKE